MIRLSHCLVPLLALSLSAQLAASPQIPDQLDGGPCCAIAPANVPIMPKFQQDAQAICWQDCTVVNQTLCKAQWTFGSGSLSPCAPRTATVRLRDAANNLKWRGNIRLQYSRTWMEVGLNGTLIQVWRFLGNGDLRPQAAAGSPPCPVPSCAASFNNRVRFTGYVDWAFDPGAGSWDTAWMLNHACDAIDHHAGFPRAGAFHPDRTFTFVGPAANFVPGISPATEGGSSTFEAMRRTVSSSAGTQCEFEERANHTLSPNNLYCYCGNPAGPPQWLEGSLSMIGGCGSTVTTPGVPYLPGFLSMSVGSWTNPNVFPGTEDLRWNTGGYDYFDACTGATSQQVFFGVTTIGGLQPLELLASGVGAPLPVIFIDQVSALRNGVTRMNTPFGPSDHVLNLNE